MEAPKGLKQNFKQTDHSDDDLLCSEIITFYT